MRSCVPQAWFEAALAQEKAELAAAAQGKQEAVAAVSSGGVSSSEVALEAVTQGAAAMSLKA